MAQRHPAIEDTIVEGEFLYRTTLLLLAALYTIYKIDSLLQDTKQNTKSVSTMKKAYRMPIYQNEILDISVSPS